MTRRERRERAKTVRALLGLAEERAAGIQTRRSYDGFFIRCGCGAEIKPFSYNGAEWVVEAMTCFRCGNDWVRGHKRSIPRRGEDRPFTEMRNALYGDRAEAMKAEVLALRRAS